MFTHIYNASHFYTFLLKIMHQTLAKHCIINFLFQYFTTIFFSICQKHYFCSKCICIFDQLLWIELISHSLPGCPPHTGRALTWFRGLPASPPPTPPSSSTSGSTSLHQVVLLCGLLWFPTGADLFTLFIVWLPCSWT